MIPTSQVSGVLYYTSRKHPVWRGVLVRVQHLPGVRIRLTGTILTTVSRGPKHSVAVYAGCGKDAGTDTIWYACRASAIGPGTGCESRSRIAIKRAPWDTGQSEKEKWYWKILTEHITAGSVIVRYISDEIRLFLVVRTCWDPPWSRCDSRSRDGNGSRCSLYKN